MATTMAGAVGTGRHESLAVGKSLLAEGVGKQLALLMAAPFIGLAYVIALPFIGAAAMVKCVVASRG